MISWLPGIPFDVIKTKMMTEDRYRGVWHCFQVTTKVGAHFLIVIFYNER